ncbi:MAG: hypothetical protein A3H41_04860 [Omnitrophica WOR_2 bacterium RIFCSPLOWO2_02_FULL_45_28]|nr:MAG: hypothetical protein A3H41_04860 [Omnitrophica WOR_2 bacterium RIFCSPLOWO2_02_FULL_45_28]
MNKEIIKLENCLKSMRKCLKIPKVENCICFSDTFKVLNSEVCELFSKINRLSDVESAGKLLSLKKEVEEILKNISKGNKECLGCNPCIASVVFKAYPNTLNNLYTNNKL